MENLLSEYFKSINIAENLKPTQLNKIGEDVALRYADDESERDEWLKTNEYNVGLFKENTAGSDDPHVVLTFDAAGMEYHWTICDDVGKLADWGLIGSMYGFF